MPELAMPAPREEVLGADRLREEAELWPLTGRFFWAPALDLHPSRREAVAPGLPDAAWQLPASLRHLSRHLLVAAGLTGMPRWHSAATAFRLAVLPADTLGRLARRVALALVGPAWPEGARAMLDEEEGRFLAERAPLYWIDTVAPVEGDPMLAGWRGLREAVSGQPDTVVRRFAWKTPLACDDLPRSGAGADALLALSARIMREFEEPWSSLFARPVR